MKTAACVCEEKMLVIVTTQKNKYFLINIEMELAGIVSLCFLAVFVGFLYVVVEICAWHLQRHH